MSIIDSYDESEALINPSSFYKPMKIAAKKCIVTFSGKAFRAILKRIKCTREAETGTANGAIPIYSFIHNGEKILIYLSPIGSAIAGTVMDEVNYITGATHFIVFGSCGSLQHDLTKGNVIVPSHAYRDEGFSYHLAPPADYIDVVNSGKVSKILHDSGIPTIIGKTWTTDAIYRETVNNCNKRRAEGCISVEMECAGLQAICDYRKLHLYMFLFEGDILESGNWNNLILGSEEEHEAQLAMFDLALIVVSQI